MKQYSKDEAIEAMNSLGSNRIPFLFIIDFLMQSPIVIPLSEVDSSSILYNIQGNSNYTHCSGRQAQVLMEKYPVSFERYSAAFKHVEKNIKDGNSYLLNLTFPTRIEINKSLREIFFISNARYKLIIEDRFVVFSPESFVQIHNGVISSYPMKGTIDASIEKAGKIILESRKETAEHTTIVDLIRNDLSIIASDVKVETFRYIEEITTNEKKLLQVSSKISGFLGTDYHKQIGTLMFKLLPAGSISGAPKKKTVEIILESEQYERGYYTGVFGIFNGRDLDSGIMIRYIEKIDGRMFYKSGGGITSLSTVEAEYQEMIDKVYVPVN